jgi:hypothetical protein
VIGDHDNVWAASISVIEATADNDGNEEAADEANAANAARMLQFINNIAPNWNGATDWVTTTMRRATAHPSTTYTKIHDGRKYMLMYEDIINTTVLTVTRADDKEDT